ncbi:MAG: rod shape-determining protein MreD [Candidatus Nanopelagicales bacterium]
MIVRQGLVIGGVLFVAFLIQVTLLSRLGLPGATPDLLVVSVVAIALAMGPIQGAFAGFLAGAIIDVSPPADTVVGVNSIVYLAIGFVTGYIIDTRDRTVPGMIAMAGIACAAAALGTAALDAMLGSPRVIWESVPLIALSSAVYGALLAPLMIPLLAGLTRKLAPEVLLD